jgi:tRNA(adenine34) deaminase
MLSKTQAAAFLTRCHELAATASALGNPSVGAVVVRHNQIVGEGVELGRSSGDVTRHAEIEALRAAVQFLNTVDLSDCVLISTHEPCVMCSYAIRFYQVRQVFFATAVPSVGGVNSRHPVLTDSVFWEVKGVPEVIQI